MALHSLPLLLLLLLLLLLTNAPPSNSSSSPPEKDDDIVAAEGDMQAASYYTFVTLMNMVRDWIPTNTTFLMPNDHLLSDALLSPADVVNFLSRHSVPSPLRFDVLRHLPTRSELPTNLLGMSLTVTNNDAQDFHLNGVKIVSPDVCVAVGSIACHGIDEIIVSERVARRNRSDYFHRCFAQGPDAVAPAPSSEGGGGSANSGGGAVVERRGWLAALVAFASLCAVGLVW